MFRRYAIPIVVQVGNVDICMPIMGGLEDCLIYYRMLEQFRILGTRVAKLDTHVPALMVLSLFLLLRSRVISSRSVSPVICTKIFLNTTTDANIYKFVSVMKLSRHLAFFQRFVNIGLDRGSFVARLELELRRAYISRDIFSAGTRRFYAFAFSLSATVVVPETVEVASAGAGSAAHASDGNLWKSAARYFGWLIP